MVLSCNAKINIGLEILNKRDDYYHNINTIFHKICISDKLFIENNKNFEFIFNSDIKIKEKDNLAYKAAMLFKDFYKFKELPVKIIVEKEVPAGAGLGGGSSDAANVIKGLAKHFNIPLEIEKLNEAVAKLGSDIPFFLLNSRTAIAQGKGEILTPVNVPFPYYILLIMPGIHISTAGAYQALHRDKTKMGGTDYMIYKDIIVNEPERMKEVFKNDFEIPVFEEFPELSLIKKELYSSGAFFAQMSGTGSTVYGLYYEEEEAKKAVEKFSKYKTHICFPD